MGNQINRIFLHGVGGGGELILLDSMGEAVLEFRNHVHDYVCGI